MENSMEAPQKTKNWVTIWSNSVAPVHVSGKDENSNLKKKCMYPRVPISTVYNSQ